MKIAAARGSIPRTRIKAMLVHLFRLSDERLNIQADVLIASSGIRAFVVL
jgi:hypothetical protein